MSASADDSQAQDPPAVSRRPHILRLAIFAAVLLTLFYLVLSLGGWIGGAFVSLVAPQLAQLVAAAGSQAAPVARLARRVSKNHPSAMPIRYASPYQRTGKGPISKAMGLMSGN
jgi:hypothetical protein